MLNTSLNKTPKKRKSTGFGVEKQKTPGSVNELAMSTVLLQNDKSPAKLKKNTPLKSPKKRKLSGTENELSSSDVLKKSDSPHNKNFRAGKDKTPKKSPLKLKRSSESDSEGNPAKKVQSDNGTPKKKKGKKGQNPDSATAPKMNKFKGTTTLGEPSDLKSNTKRIFIELQKKVSEKGKEKVINEIETKVQAIHKRELITKTAKRKLKHYKTMINIVNFGADFQKQVSANQKKQENTASTSSRRRRRKNKQKVEKSEKVGENEKNILNKKGQKGQDLNQKTSGKKNAKAQQIQKVKEEVITENGDGSSEEENSDIESDDSNYEVERNIKADKIGKNLNSHLKNETGEEEGSEEQEDESDGNKEESDGDEEESDGDEKESDGEEESGEEGDEVAESEESEENQPQKKKPKVQTDKKGKQKPREVQLEDLKKNDMITKGQSRYVLFVGNLPYDATKEQVSKHFEKIGQIVSIRIPVDKTSSKPRGFCYVEVGDENTYQKAFSLHGSTLNNRKLVVQYTQGGKKKGEERKKEIKAKNFKLHGMMKQGKLAGSVKESNKRAFRRGKGKPEVSE